MQLRTDTFELWVGKPPRERKFEGRGIFYHSAKREFWFLPFRNRKAKLGYINFKRLREKTMRGFASRVIRLASAEEKVQEAERELFGRIISKGIPLKEWDPDLDDVNRQIIQLRTEGAWGRFDDVWDQCDAKHLGKD